MRIGFLIACAVAAVLTFILHEAAHFAAGEALGYDMFVRANSSGLARGEYRTETDAMVVTMAGPAFTLLQALIAFVIARGTQSASAFAFVLSALLMRMLAAGVSLGNPNDEARFSLWLGLGPWAMFAVVIGALLVLTVIAARAAHITWRDVALGVVVWMIFASAIILGERQLPMYVSG